MRLQIRDKTRKRIISDIKYTPEESEEQIYSSDTPRAGIGGRVYSMDCKCSSGWKTTSLPREGIANEW